ncbi:hypothetical protein GCM10009689_37290 [Brevibacterium antiquum]|uniref:hypothetical protein n=1 Tax=Brevibacterium antiquum TaxID=234835 RepID=UPI001E2B8B19|nr:hypothetical protein [Brevibacterium antiquum]
MRTFFFGVAFFAAAVVFFGPARFVPAVVVEDDAFAVAVFFTVAVFGAFGALGFALGFAAVFFAAAFVFPAGPTAGWAGSADLVDR